jgi:hypothetical protein
MGAEGYDSSTTNPIVFICTPAFGKFPIAVL